MNVIPQVFLLFFAIFFGFIASVQPRWKPYPWDFREEPQACKRLGLSLIILNVFPIVFFGIAMKILWKGTVNPDSFKCCDILKIVIFGIIPAYSVFGFYRLWLGIIEKSPDSYYKCSGVYKRLYKTENDKEVELTPENWNKNIRVGWGYIVFASSPLIIKIIWNIILLYNLPQQPH